MQKYDCAESSALETWSLFIVTLKGIENVIIFVFLCASKLMMWEREIGKD